MKKPKTEPSLKELERAFDGDLDLVLFFLKWIQNGRNATKAYLELNPKVDPASARVLGSRQLSKVNIFAILDTYGLGIETYMQQLVEGLQADRSDMTGQILPDHRTRKAYHETLGKLLGVETQGASINITGDKVLVMPSELITKYGIPSNTEDSSRRQP